MTTLSVVLPVLDEREHLPGTLELLRAEGDLEVIVVDGGSADGTWELRHDHPGVRFVRAPRGRGRQMNAGAALARGDALLFLHADSRPPAGFSRAIGGALAEPGVVAGSFRLRFDHGHPLLRFYASCSRSSRALFTYGDQGLFVGRETFEAIGGFAPIPLMEDVEIQRRLRRRGRFVKLAEPVVTSARRFLRHGIVRQQLRNAALVLAYRAGAEPARLARRYGDRKG